jgi:protein phosphatase
MKELSFPSNSLIVLCGPAGSGKSYFARRFFQPSQIVSSDQCRKMIADDPGNQAVSPEAFKLFYKIIEYRLKYHRLTLADATNLTGRFRSPLIRLAQKFQRPICLILFETDLEHCLKQNSLRGRKVRRDVILSQYEKFVVACRRVREEPYQKIFSLSPGDIETLQIILEPASLPPAL